MSRAALYWKWLGVALLAGAVLYAAYCAHALLSLVSTFGDDLD